VMIPKDPNEMCQTQTQLCFCGEKRTPIPWEPLVNHSIGCVAWDWALAARKITLAQRIQQLDQYRKNLGDTDASSTETNT
jgi:hypothetical protein